MTKINEKYDISRDKKQDLKVYFFTALEHDANLKPVKEHFRAIIGYELDDTLAIIKKEFSAGPPVAINEKGRIPVEKLLENLNLEKPQKVEVKEQKAKKLTEKEFINGLLLVADKFVKNKKDKEELKNIIKRIK